MSRSKRRVVKEVRWVSLNYLEIIVDDPDNFRN